jgi:uncharacterized protein HemX
MGETQIVPATASTKVTGGSTIAYLSAHPVGVLVVGSLLLGIGAYYFGKAMANRANRKKAEKVEQVAAPVAA